MSNLFSLVKIISILVKNRTRSLLQSYFIIKEENFDENHILSFESLDLAKTKIAEFNKQNQKYVLLFENDLPDNYNE